MFDVFPEEGGMVVRGDVAALLTVPGSFAMDAQSVGMPFDLASCIALAALGLDPPSPMLYDYQWPRDLTKIPFPFEHQKDTARFLTVNPHAYCLNGIGCVDATTEYLSPTGWRRIDQYDGGQVGQYELDGTMEFVQPLRYIKEPCTEMIRLKSKYGVDQLLSPNHNVLYVGSTGGRHTMSAAALERAQHRTKSGWSGQFITTFTPTLTTQVDLTAAQLRVQVAVIADGHFPNRTSRCIMRLKRGRKKERIRALLTSAKIEWREHQVTVGTAIGFTVFSFLSPMRVKEFGPEFYRSSAEQLRVIASELGHWDGHERSSGGTAFTSCIKASADFAHYAYAATGRTARMLTAVRADKGNVEYTVHARSKAALVYLMGDSHGVKSENVWREPSPDGFMYCFEVPSHFLILRRNGCIFATGNSGKTLSIAWAADYLMDQGYVRKAVINSPLSTLERAWGDTFFFNLPHRSYSVIHGDKARRRKQLDKDVDFYIINHHGVEVMEDELKDRDDIDLVATDEIASYRNSRTAMWAALNKVLWHGKRPVPWSWGATGAPRPNNATDPYGQGKLITPHTFPKFFGQWRNLTMEKRGLYQWDERKEANTIIFNSMRPAIRYSREECIDLPPELHTQHHVEMSSEQSKHYKEMTKNLATEIKGDKIRAVNEGVKRLKLLQIACGVVYNEDGAPVLIDNRSRIEEMLQIIEQCDEKVIVYVPFTEVTNLLAAKISKYWSTAVVHGGVPKGQRDTIFGDFQQKRDPSVLVAHPQCMAHGLTLTESSTILWYAPVDSNDIFTQANGRITRPGQKYTANIRMLEASPLERAMYKRLEERKSTQGVLLEMVERGEL
jgi:hypothetical protein